MHVKSSSLILVLLLTIIVSIWIDSTESITSVFSILFTVDKPEIILDSFPYDKPFVSVMVPPSTYPCVWFINDNNILQYYHNDTHLQL